MSTRYFYESLSKRMIIGMARTIAERGWRRVTRVLWAGTKREQKRKVYVNDYVPGVFYWSLTETYRESEFTRRIVWQNAGRLHRKCRRAHA